MGLAPPERDLWWVLSDGGAPARRYAEAAGRVPDPAGLTLYRIRWALDGSSWVKIAGSKESSRT